MAPEIFSLTEQRMSIHQMILIETGGLNSVRDLINLIVMLLAEARE